jgi:hypothetical protein
MRAEEERLILRKKRSELDDELRFIWSKSIATEVAAGLTASEARRQALIEFGAVESMRDQCDEQRPGSWMGTIAQDARYAAYAAQIAERYLCRGQYASGSEDDSTELNPSRLQPPFDRRTDLASDAYPICRWLWLWHSESRVRAIMEAEYVRSRLSL